ncbi:MAG: enoyl-CoA hydratase/isomerase family protein [Gammaproteobacteria bacterium]|nr:enoyl-CoA hydratase/isomerase family protein [Gammaproteobacteria bacterium]
MTDQTVLFETLDTASGHRFGRATLNAPASLNALSLAMVDLLDPQLAAWAEDPSVAGVLLDAAGDRAFCAGGDVVSICHAIRALPAGEVPAEAAAFFEHEYRLDHRIHTYPKPLICWGHGFVMGGGIGLMSGASHRVATPRTRMAMPEISIGLYPDVGGSWLLSRLPGRTGAFLALTGAQLNAADALFAGLADFVLTHEQHAAVIEAIRATAWRGDGQADAAALSQLLASLALRDALPESPLRGHFDRINTLIGHDTLADMAGRLQVLATDADPWLAQAAATSIKGSPTSAALGLEMQRRARHLSLAQTFRLELQASMGCCAHPDFPEGVRALLIDKDRNPQWQPATLAEVTPEWLEDHLRPRFDGPHPLADLGP